LVVLTLLTGIVFPVAMTFAAQTLFPYRASGSILLVEGLASAKRPTPANAIKQPAEVMLAKLLRRSACAWRMPPPPIVGSVRRRTAGPC